jgi:DNA-binding MarR family transcriptional regulator/GNAT superfamily N-acetyltransferase
MASGPDRVSAVRHFNRFYTRQIGVLREGLLHSPYPLTEARIIYELGNRDGLTAAQLGRELGLDPGYLSRTLGRFEEQGLLERVRDEVDARQRLLSLTARGREAFAVLDRRSHEEISEMLGQLSEEDQQRLLAAMRTIEGVLDTSLGFAEPFIIRHHHPGDMGWVVHRHGALYHDEYGWDERFEALVAQVVADYINKYDPARDRCWIAEMGGEIVGSVFLVNAGDGMTAKLRLLLVEPRVRGMGLGTRLVREAIRFARRAGYRKMTLWTNHVLLEARHIYAKLGFSLVAEDPHHSFGHDLIGETWELVL